VLRVGLLAVGLLLGSCARPDPDAAPVPAESPPIVARPGNRVPRNSVPGAPAPRDTAIRDSTARPAPPPADPVAADPGPAVRVGIVISSPSVTVGGGATLRAVAGPTAITIPAGATWRVMREGARLVLLGPSGIRTAPAPEFVVVPASRGAFVRIGTREYRGTVALAPARTGVSAINEVGLEEYLLSVVGGELGRRAPDEIEAVRAQAIVSRTYALRNRGRWRARGFDYNASVADQVYFGVGVENPLSRRAVAETRGIAVTWGGAPIDAFFFSTCGGRTEQGIEVFRGAARPYLRSVSDAGPAGGAYCAISPRYEWREAWSGPGLREALRRYLPGEMKIAASRVSRVRDVRIADRTVSRRVRTLIVSLPDGDVAVESPSIREALRPASGEILPSTAFSVRVTHAGGEVARLEVDGHGAGHGVGFCQWGAVGRARAGHRHEDIIAAYYPGTRLERAY
jgi:stage II sporulation protein D